LISVPEHKDPKERNARPQNEDTSPRFVYSEAAAESAAPTNPAGDPAGVGATKQEDAPAGSLADQIHKLEAEKQDLTNTLVRRQADFENYRKRVEKERHQERHRGVEVMVEHLLPVLDGFERALAAHDDPAYAEYRKGFELIRKQLWDALAKAGLERIESVGKEFNPHLHHAIERVETAEHSEGSVLEELQPGYVFHGRVLRPAMVRVAAEPAQAARRQN
jgi:molecular chaperone GrpE